MTADEELRRALRECIDYARLSPTGERRSRWEAALAARSEPRASKVWQNGYEVTITEGKVEQRPGLDLTGYGSEPRAEGLREASERLMAAFDWTRAGAWVGLSDAEWTALYNAVRDIRAALAATPPAEGRPGREQEAYDAGRLAGYEEGLAATPPAEGLRTLVALANGYDGPPDELDSQRLRVLIEHIRELAATPREAT